MKLTRVENRCDCGFLIGSGLCETHDTPRERNENKVTRKEVLTPGAEIGGSKVLRLIDETYAEMQCGGCDKPFIARRSSIIKARLKGTNVRCSGRCRTRKEAAA